MVTYNGNGDITTDASKYKGLPQISVNWYTKEKYRDVVISYGKAVQGNGNYYGATTESPLFCLSGQSLTDVQVASRKAVDSWHREIKSLRILEIIREVDLNDNESIVTAASNIYAAQCRFTGFNSALVNIPDDEYMHLNRYNEPNIFDHYDIGIDNLKTKFEKDVQELLWYCARIGVEVV